MSNQFTKKHELVKQTAYSNLRLLGPKGADRPRKLPTDKQIHNEKPTSPISPLPVLSLDLPSSHTCCGTPRHLRHLTLLKDHSFSSGVGLSSTSIASFDSGLGLSRDPSKSSLLGRTSEEFDSTAELSPLTSDELNLTPHSLDVQAKILNSGLDDLQPISEDGDSLDQNPFSKLPAEKERANLCLVSTDNLENLFQAFMKIEDDVILSPRLRSNPSDDSLDKPQHSCCYSQQHQHHCQESTDDLSSERDGPYEPSARRHSSNKHLCCNRRRFSNDREVGWPNQYRRKGSVPSLRRVREERLRKTLSCSVFPRKRANTCPANVGARLAQPSVVIKRAIPRRLRKQCTEVLKVCTRGESHFEELVMNLQHRKIDHELQSIREAHLARLVKENLPEFIEMTDWTYFLGHVIAKDLADPNTQQKLMSTNTSMTTIEKSNYFYIQVLPSKGRDAYSRFYKCLCGEKLHSGHQYLASLLRQGLSC